MEIHTVADQSEVLEFLSKPSTLSDVAPVRGLTLGYYKYPARFSPAFVRAAIETFTAPGDLCLDPHVGGVEALALGRHGVGVDISTLAHFVAEVKTTLFSETELDRLEAWAKRIRKVIDIRQSTIHFADDAERGYYKHSITLAAGAYGKQLNKDSEALFGLEMNLEMNG
jgi:hypothetical protein